MFAEHVWARAMSLWQSMIMNVFYTGCWIGGLLPVESHPLQIFGECSVIVGNEWPKFAAWLRTSCELRFPKGYLLAV